YRLIFLPPELSDYIIVHELCHLGEMNHSAKFWQLVAKEKPGYLALRRELKKINLSII
ncbi:M48 family metallopeptidase, partial [Candidatus Falkowbacteria bacterium]|nr:M48 family metallopeptidase [Candidatus Falkowbacteria bacterium]